jgi:hypothetical protein
MFSGVLKHCTTDRAIAGVSCGQFGTFHLKYKLSKYIQETVDGKWEGLYTESFKSEKRLAADNRIG